MATRAACVSLTARARAAAVCVRCLSTLAQHHQPKVYVLLPRSPTLALVQRCQGTIGTRPVIRGPSEHVGFATQDAGAAEEIDEPLKQLLNGLRQHERH